MDTELFLFQRPWASLFSEFKNPNFNKTPQRAKNFLSLSLSFFPLWTQVSSLRTISWA